MKSQTTKVKNEQIRETIRRRKLIKKICEETGITNGRELARLLSRDYDIDVSHETVYNDLRFISAFKKGEIRIEKNLIVEKMNKALSDLEDIRDNAVKPSDRIYANRAINMSGKEMLRVLDLLTEVDESVPEKKERNVDEEDEDEQKIRFG